MIAIKLRVTDYSGLVALANHVKAALTGNGNFTTPSPTLVALAAAIADVEAALALRGDVHNHGTSADVVDLRTKARTLRDMLTSLAAYVSNVAQTTAGSDYDTMAALMLTSGFSLKGVPTPQGLLMPVRNLHRVVDASLNPNVVKMAWMDPEGVTSKSNVKSCIVFKSTTPVFSEAVQVATVSKNEFTDSNNTSGLVKWFYWIVPVGAAGNGAVSDVLMVSLPPI